MYGVNIFDEDYGQEAAVVDSSPGVIANEINPRPGQLEAERQTAKERIQTVLGAIQNAVQSASRKLQLP